MPLVLQDLRDPKETLGLMVETGNPALLVQMDHQKTEDHQDFLVLMDLMVHEACMAHREKEEMEANLEKKAHQAYLDCKVHLVHWDRGEKEVKMVLLEKKVHRD